MVGHGCASPLASCSQTGLHVARGWRKNEVTVQYGLNLVLFIHFNTFFFPRTLLLQHLLLPVCLISDLNSSETFHQTETFPCFPISSFLECIPRSFKKHISGANILTKIRIKRVFRNFVHKFQQHTVDNGRLGTYEIIYKYISTFEQMAPTFGTETFLVLSLELRDELGENCSFSGTPAQGALKDCYGASTTYEVMVTGTKGIHWREQLSTQKVRQGSEQTSLL